VDRLACVDLPAFPLQLLCRRHPDWRGLPVVVVTEDKPQGVITWVNEKARAARILPGQRYAHALSLAADLRAGVISDDDVALGVAEVCERLRAFSPAIEPYADRPGVFWLDASGLERLYGSLRHWGREVFGHLREQGWNAALVLGFTRFGTYAVARARPHGVTLFDDEPGERAAARDVPL
jgi:protein ImuB